MKVDFYSHLKKDYKSHFNIDETAKTVAGFNYGCREMIIAILKVREDDLKENGRNSKFCEVETKKLRELLEGGFY